MTTFVDSNSAKNFLNYDFNNNNADIKISDELITVRYFDEESGQYVTINADKGTPLFDALKEKATVLNKQRYIINDFEQKVTELAKELAEILAENKVLSSVISLARETKKRAQAGIEALCSRLNTKVANPVIDDANDKKEYKKYLADETAARKEEFFAGCELDNNCLFKAPNLNKQISDYNGLEMIAKTQFGLC